MILKRFRQRLKYYGYRRLLTSPDIILSFIITVFLYGVQQWSCGLQKFPCIQVTNFDFVAKSIPVLSALTSFVITGLAVLVTLTDEDFLGEMSELGVYPRVLFMFEFNILLLGLTAFFAVFIDSYSLPPWVFYIFTFLLFYSLISLTELMQLIVNTGINKAHYERREQE